MTATGSAIVPTGGPARASTIRWIRVSRVGRPGDRIARGEGLLVQPGVLEGDRGQLGELVRASTSGWRKTRSRRAGGEPEDADDAAADGQRRARRRRRPCPSYVGRVALERVVVVDRERPAGAEDLAADAPSSTGMPEPDARRP